MVMPFVFFIEFELRVAAQYGHRLRLNQFHNIHVKYEKDS